MNRDQRPKDKKRKCYLCASSERLTKDHIPPDCFFPPDAKLNLITVNCCEKCNNEFSKDDEEMVRWLTTSIFASNQGKWIFQNKVAKTLKKSVKLSQRSMNSLREISLETQEGKMKGYALPVSTEVFNRFTIRICKGLLTKFLPDFDYSKTTFLVENILPSFASNKMIEDMLSKMNCTTKGDTVFRFWHSDVTDHPDKGIFVLMFYEGAVFICMYGNDIKLPH